MTLGFGKDFLKKQGIKKTTKEKTDKLDSI